MLEKLKKDNKGFTLIELIVVIAILAILAAVLAPQYIKYIEKSRESTDKQALNELVEAAKIAVSDTESLGTTNITLTWTQDSTDKSKYTLGAQTTGAAKTVYDAVVTSIGNSGTIYLKSAKAQAKSSFVVKIDVTGKTYGVTLAPTIETTFPTT